MNPVRVKTGTGLNHRDPVRIVTGSMRCLFGGFKTLVADVGGERLAEPQP